MTPRRDEFRLKLAMMFLDEFKDIAPIERLHELMLITAIAIKTYGIDNDSAAESFYSVLLDTEDVVEELRESMIIANTIGEA